MDSPLHCRSERENATVRIKWVLGILSVGVIALFVLVGPIMSNVELPNYSVIYKEGNIELRSYEKMLLAEVAVDGRRDDAIKAGFRILADFIFGNNEDSSKISMTAPVQQELQGDNWFVSFVMPENYDLENIPKPLDKSIKIRWDNGGNYLSIRFSGRGKSANISSNERILLDYLQNKRYETKGPLKYAFYNPPWTIPMLRRNEIMIQVTSEAVK
mgnify:CR=1 FL=1